MKSTVCVKLLCIYKPRWTLKGEIWNPSKDLVCSQQARWDASKTHFNHYTMWLHWPANTFPISQSCDSRAIYKQNHEDSGPDLQYVMFTSNLSVILIEQMVPFGFFQNHQRCSSSWKQKTTSSEKRYWGQRWRNLLSLLMWWAEKHLEVHSGWNGV